MKGLKKKKKKSRPLTPKRSDGGRAFTLVEIVVALSIFVFVITGIISIFSYSIRNATFNTKKMQASFLVEEGLEAVKMIRDRGWSSNIATLSTNIDHYLYFDGITWISTTTPEIIEETFERKFVFYDIFRNIDYDIASSGVLDPNSKLVIVSVFWDKGGVIENKEISTIITNIFED